jgi:acyl-CoA reductase-like NAD-dependent aldehyde dehydrogenase
VRVRRYAGQGAVAATHVAAANGLPAEGFYVAPTLLVGLPDEHPVIQAEILGPVLAWQSVASIEAACAKVDASRFALSSDQPRRVTKPNTR